jgi:hypothetical protein
MMAKYRIAVLGVVAALLGIVLPTLSNTAPAQAAAPVVPSPTVSGPITGGVHNRPWFQAPFNPADYGYSQKEYFYSGTATSFGVTAPPARYQTRMLVYAPTDPAKFSGNVIVEWNNVTLQADVPVHFTYMYPQLLANGDAIVEITAQQAGLCGLGLSGKPLVSLLGVVSVAVCNPLSVKGYDPVRYAPLVHPGDSYSYDIFSQGAQALLHPKGVSPLGGLQVKRLIASGQSQSAVELDHYILDGADGAAKLFDGFLIDGDVQAVLPASYRVPTIHLWSEESAQPVASTSGPNHRIWSVAGMAHSDAWWLAQSIQGLAASELNLPQVSRAQHQVTEAALSDYGQAGIIDTFPTRFPRRFVVDAALTALQTWIHTGLPAPSAPPLELSGVGEVLQSGPRTPVLPAGLDILPSGINALGLIGSPLALERDANGIAKGGLRLSWITVPVASYNGTDGVLVGTSVPLLNLHSLYPTHAKYVADMIAATRTNVADRFLTGVDAVSLITMACSSAIPEWGTTPADQQPAACRNPKAALGIK